MCPTAEKWRQKRAKPIHMIMMNVSMSGWQKRFFTMVQNAEGDLPIAFAMHTHTQTRAHSIYAEMWQDDDFLAINIHLLLPEHSVTAKHFPFDLREYQ